jgi:hypothetical protein
VTATTKPAWRAAASAMAKAIEGPGRSGHRMRAPAAAGSGSVVSTGVDEMDKEGKRYKAADYRSIARRLPSAAAAALKTPGTKSAA